jgi:protein O-mannosyl-transferase
MPRFRIVAWCLALITPLIYLPVRVAGFVYDDRNYLVNNPIVRKGLTWPGIRWAFTSFDAANWHPLTWLSHMLDCQLFGMNPGAQHVVNVILHTANALLLFLLLFRLTNRLWPSALVAALFAWHPLHVESVAWIAERKDVLSTLFALLSLLAYERFVREKPLVASQSKWPSNFYWSLAFFALALMSKPMPVTLPFVLLLLDCWPFGRISISDFQFPVFLRLVREKWPFFVLSAASCVVTVLAQKSGEAVRTLDQVSLAIRFENTAVAYALYLWKTIWPVNLAVYYPLPDQIPPLAVAISLAMLIAISIAVWLPRKTCPYLLVGWLWFLGTLVPVIGLVQVGSAALADRYSYFPLIGVFIAIAFGLKDLVERRRVPATVVIAPSAVVLAACLVLTANQASCWQNEETLFRHDLAVVPDNPSAHFWIAMFFEDNHRNADALDEFRKAEELNTNFMSAHFMIAGLLNQLGQPNEALDEYRQALRVEPENPALLDRYGLVLVALGHYDAAVDQFTAASRADPADAQPHFNLAMLSALQGNDAAAVPEFREAVRLDPDNPQILTHAAELLAASEDPQARDGQTALVYALKANELAGENQPFILDALGMAYAETGDFDHAQQAVQRALDLAAGAPASQIAPLQQRLARYQSHQPWRQSFRLSRPAPPSN